MFQWSQHPKAGLTIREFPTSYLLLLTSTKEGAMGTQRLFVDKPTAILEGYSVWINE